jgi:hypothetical protein
VFWADPHALNRFNIEHENGCGIPLSPPEVARECGHPHHVKATWNLGANALKERLHCTVTALRYLWQNAAFAATVGQKSAVHAIAQGSGTEPNAPTCELLRSADDITQTDFYRFGTRRGLGRTLYISRASIIPPWRFGCFRGPGLQGRINGERTPETHVPADHN